MAIEANIGKKESEKIALPVLMKSTTSDLIVLFVKKTEGVVVNRDNMYEYGHYENFWVDYRDTSHWEKFEGTITLENK